jgi:hypothetical protein
MRRKAPMKSTDVYRTIRETIGPWCKSAGFKRAPGGMLGWVRPAKAKHLLFWCQCSQFGWESYSGSQFVVEFQLAPGDRLGTLGRGSKRKRLGQMLLNGELQRATELQNAVIGKLVQPPRDHPLLGGSTEVTRLYLDSFARLARPYRSDDDVWFRYHDDEDVVRWAQFLGDVLPRVIAAFEKA